jgi:PKD repeat protein
MKKYLCIIVILILLGSGCKKDTTTHTSPAPTPVPVACVSPLASDTVYQRHSISFFSCTKGATSYLWNFGDGSTATTDTAIHTYSVPGTYTVTFTPSNSGGAGTPYTITITVLPSGGSWTFKGVTYTTEICGPGNYSFSAYSYPNDSNFLSLKFDGAAITSGTYSVYPLPSGFPIGILLTKSTSVGYSSVGGANQTVTLTSVNGVLTASGTNIRMGSSTDTALLTFNITQTQ